MLIEGCFKKTDTLSIQPPALSPVDVRLCLQIILFRFVSRPNTVSLPSFEIKI